MAKKEEIKEIDSKNISVLTTETKEIVIAKVTLEAQKADLLQQIADIDEKLTHFKKEIVEE